MGRSLSISIKIIVFIIIGAFFFNLEAIPVDTNLENPDFDAFRKNDSKLMMVSYIVSGSTAFVFTGLSLMMAPPLVVYLIGFIESALLSLGKKDFENILNIFKGSFAAVTTICILAAVLTDILVFF